MIAVIGSRHAKATSMIPALVGGICVALVSQQLLAQNQNAASNPCDAIASGFGGTVTCAWAPSFAAGTTEVGSTGIGGGRHSFLVQEYEDFGLANQTKVAFSTIFDAQSAEKARLLTYARLKEPTEQVLDDLKNGTANPVITVGTGKRYVITPTEMPDGQDWAKVWELLAKGVQNGYYMEIGVVSDDESLLAGFSQKEKIFSWGDNYGILSTTEE
jgi:hypothetical protein